MKIRYAISLFFSVIWLGLLTTASGQATQAAAPQVEIEPGFRREDVLRIIGQPEYSAKIGDIETLSFKGGTKLVLRKGIVEEVSVPGQVRMGDSVKIIETRPAAKPAPIPTRAPAPTPTPAPTVAAVTTNAAPATASVSDTNTASIAATAVAAPARPRGGATAAAAEGIAAKVQKMMAGMLLIIGGVALVFYVFNSFCFQLICDKAGKPGGALVWIPIAQFIPLLRVADMRPWMLALLLIPVVNVGFMVFMWARICTARGKSPWLVVALFVPVVNLAFVPYLAFSGGSGDGEEKDDGRIKLDVTPMPEDENLLEPLLGGGLDDGAAAMTSTDLPTEQAPAEGDLPEGQTASA